jgi:histidinol dehydrogenase
MINFKEIDIKEKVFSIELDNFLNTRSLNSSEVSSIVAEIITSVRNKGDEAIRFYTKQFDKFDCDDFLVSDQELNVATENIEKDLIRSFEYAFDNILSYQSGCYETLAIESSEEQISRRFRALNSVGMYIPGGKASYPSTVLMGAAPALACGIKDICLTTPLSNGALNGLTLAAAKVAGIEKIYKIGGAQAVAALALGTEQVLKVDKIIGPGNVYVAEAKKQLFGEVGIDSIAGPSEIVILADETSDPETVAWDLMAQSEHDPDASAILISSSSDLINNVKAIINAEVNSLQRSSIITKSLESNGLFIKISDLNESKELINKLAPEHLHLAYEHNHILDENNLVAGLIMKGKATANSLSDYVLGPSHILPTNTSSRFSSPLSVEDFLVSYSYISLKQDDPQLYRQYVEHTSRIARAEGLTAHAIAAEKRIKS